MTWRSLLEDRPVERLLPWVGGRTLVDPDRTFQIRGPLPPEHGWHRFAVGGSRRVSWSGVAEPDPTFDEGREHLQGYLVGNRLVPDDATVVPDPTRLVEQTVQVHLVERGLPRFSRARVARDPGGPWVFVRAVFPLGPEPEVQQAFEADRPDLHCVEDVTPALDLAYRFVRWQRQEAVRRREEAARRRLEEQAARERAERRDRLFGGLGSAEGRRAMAAVDFEAAARAALRTAGATYLDHRDGYAAHEVVVQFRFERQRFECVVDRTTLRVVDAGICLIDHQTDERGDTRFTLESLPGVIHQAMREHNLVVFRHVEEP